MDDSFSGSTAPPSSALRRPDGTYLQTLDNGVLVRWTKRPDGSWRKPERIRVGPTEQKWLREQEGISTPCALEPAAPSTLKEKNASKTMGEAQVVLLSQKEASAAREGAAAWPGAASSQPLQPWTVGNGTNMGNHTAVSGKLIEGSRSKTSCDEPVVLLSRLEASVSRDSGSVTAAVVEKVARLSSLKDPPEEAIQQADGSFLVTLEDESTLRWTRRPNGTWRKPEHKRAGWASDLAPQNICKGNIGCDESSEALPSTSVTRTETIGDAKHWLESSEVRHQRYDGLGDAKSALNNKQLHHGSADVASDTRAWHHGSADVASDTRAWHHGSADVASDTKAWLGDKLVQRPRADIEADARTWLKNKEAQHTRTDVASDANSTRNDAKTVSQLPRGQHSTNGRISTNGGMHDRELAKKIARFSSMRDPPEEAEAQADGSYVLTLEDQSSIRWTRRPDGTWRKPEHKRAGWASDLDRSIPSPAIAENQPIENGSNAINRGHAIGSDLNGTDDDQRMFSYEGTASGGRTQKNAASISAANKAIAEKVKQLSALPDPPEEAEAQADGSFLLVLEDQSSLRWTKRPNGTWRKPEHKRAGWVGELEQEKYVAPHVRAREELRASEPTVSNGGCLGLDEFDFEPRSRRRSQQQLWDPEDRPTTNVINQFKLLTFAEQGWQ